MKDKSKSTGTNSKELKGKTAFIAGGSAGTGFAMAQAFGQLGMNIVLADSEALDLETAVQKLRTENVPTEGLLTNVSNSADLRDAAEKAKSFFGKVHIVCNYAGTKIRPSQFFLPQAGQKVDETKAKDSLDKKPKVVIVGGGFGGLYAAEALANEAVSVTLIDRKNHHTFQPLLYQVATSVLSPGEIATPLRHIISRAKNVEVILGEVMGIDTKARTVLLDGGGELEFDYLVVAAGARHSYFGHDEWEHDAPGLKSVEDATEIRGRILRAFESAERQSYLTGEYPPLHFAVIGGGPTGVELAGAIADIARRAMSKDFREIDPSQARISIFEGSPRVLGMYSEKLSASAKRQLEELGVEVKTGSLVTAVEPGRIKVGDEWIPTSVTLWATGVAASPLGRMLDSETDRAGRVSVEPDLSIKSDKNIFVIGDMALLTDTSGVAVPGLAAAATQEGKATAANILRDIRGKARVPFRYRDKGTMATIGRNRAVAQIGRFGFSGYVARVLWAVVHIALLGGAHNRLMVLREWLWARYSRERSSRLITENDSEKLAVAEIDRKVPLRQ